MAKIPLVMNYPLSCRPPPHTHTYAIGSDCPAVKKVQGFTWTGNCLNPAQHCSFSPKLQGTSWARVVCAPQMLEERPLVHHLYCLTYGRGDHEMCVSCLLWNISRRVPSASIWIWKEPQREVFIAQLAFPLLNTRPVHGVPYELKPRTARARWTTELLTQLNFWG